MRIGLTKAKPNKRPECWMTIRACSMDGNTGRSEGATAEKAVPFPCAVIDPNRSFVELRVGEHRLSMMGADHELKLVAQRLTRLTFRLRHQPSKVRKGWAQPQSSAA
jgi:hypothetical protein